MKIVDAIRHLSLHYLDVCKDYLPEDAYDDGKVIIENTPDKKLVKKLKRHLEPIGDFISMENITVADLRKSGFIAEDASPSEEKINEMLQHAKMSYSIINIVSEMDEDMLAQVENLSEIMHSNLQSQVDSLPQDSTTSPEDLFKLLAGNMDDIIQQEGEQNSELGSMLQKSIPSMLKTISSANTKSDKSALLDKFSKIDGKL